MRTIALLAAAALAAPAAAHAAATVNGSNRTEMLDCAGGPAVVNGTGNRLVFHGNCSSLQINGANNQVEIDLAPGGALGVNGTGNHVLYTPIVPGPVLATRGADNSIAAGSFGAASAALAPPVPASPPPQAAIAAPRTANAGTLLLRGDRLYRDVDCASRNVLIEGSEGSFTLRGGCRSVTVQGNDDAVSAALQPGARIAIGGDGVTVHYRLVAAGPPPVVSITGHGSQTVNVATNGSAAVAVPGAEVVVGAPAH